MSHCKSFVINLSIIRNQQLQENSSLWSPSVSLSLLSFLPPALRLLLRGKGGHGGPWEMKYFFSCRYVDFLTQTEVLTGPFSQLDKRKLQLFPFIMSSKTSKVPGNEVEADYLHSMQKLETEHKQHYQDTPAGASTAQSFCFFSDRVEGGRWIQDLKGRKVQLFFWTCCSLC